MRFPFRSIKGEFVSIIGPSGSGKTTLVNLLGCLDNPSSGELRLGDRSIFGKAKRLSERDLTKIRREAFGYIFQNFYLIPTLSVLENVVLPLTFYCKPGADDEALKLLKLLGIDNRKDHLPGQISGGEMQRVAIARAMVNKPEILLADEPTGNLDTKRSVEIVQVLRELNKTVGLTISHGHPQSGTGPMRGSDTRDEGWPYFSDRTLDRRYCNEDLMHPVKY